ncbi:MAG: SDR family NAD(P)-dependent oxidoreductase [Piscinibacter sp.]|nr:SDR family NAD(P)-dependent oxidoreductase [Piscinibacter sp.]
MSSPVALIVGAGPGIGGAFAAALVGRGYDVVVAARDRARLQPLADRLGARAGTADAADPASLRALFAQLDAEGVVPDVVLYNPGARVRGPITELDDRAVAQALQLTAMGGFVTAQEAARRMLPRGRGTILFTGATASVKGFAQSAPFAMAKFAVRGLAQSLARELSPQGIHVAHLVVDGAVEAAGEPGAGAARRFTPEAVAAGLLALLDQPPGAWSWELELRRFDERF